jgi:hypothetical protein
LHEFLPNNLNLSTLNLNNGLAVKELPPMKFIDLPNIVTELRSDIVWGKTTGSHIFLYVLMMIVIMVIVGGILLVITWKFGNSWWKCPQRQRPPLKIPAPAIPLHQVEDGIFVPKPEGITIQS